MSLFAAEGLLAEIYDGKVDNNKLSFSVTVNATVLKFEGTMDGDEIKLLMKSDRGISRPR
jgi:hypothetical protein